MIRWLMVTSASLAARSEEFFAKPERYLERNYRIILRTEIVRDLLGALSNKQIIDFGCGDGAIARKFLGNGNTVTLIDKSPAMIGEARRAVPHIHVASVVAKCADILSYKGKPADIVLAIGVLAHVRSTEELFTTVARNMKPGSRCVIQFSDSGRFLNMISSFLFRIRGRHYRKTPRDEVMSAARSHGLFLVREQSHLLVVPGIPRLIGRWLLAYDRATRRYSLLASQGLDTLALFEKR